MLSLFRTGVVCLLLLGGFLTGTAAAAWYNPGWAYRQKITILSTVTTGTLTNFPYLVRITDPANAVFANAQASGNDLLFTSADGTTKLDHEIESYNSASGELWAWVRIPSLSAVTDTEIYLYYGNASAINQQNKAGVWSNGYVAVYHLHGDFDDSADSHPGTNTGSFNATGRIADGQEFAPQGGVDYVSLDTWNVSGNQLTIQAWINPDTFIQDDPRILSKAFDTTEQGHVWMLSLTNGTSGENRLRARLKTGTSDTAGTTTLIANAGAGDLPSSGQWYHFALTYNGSTMRLVMNGTDVGSIAKSGDIRQNSWQGMIGNNPNNFLPDGYSWNGKLDEVRFSSVARSLVWLTAESRNQGTPATYQILSGAEALISIFGTVFEDVNYGGGAGRDRASSSGVVRSGARVELYNNAGAYITAVATDNSGNYSFPGLAAGSYTVRVVGASVTSSRSGYVAGLLPVQTFRTNASTGTAVAVTDYVGGHDPATADAGNAGAGWTLNAGTGVFSGSGSGKAHAFAPVTVSAANVTGVDFGWNFDTIANTNNAGQGSLRQFLTNANTLGGDASLLQSGLVAAKENAVFMISNGTAAAGLRAANNYFSGGVATIAPASALPTISTPMVIVAQKQPGWTLAPIVELNGTSLGANAFTLTAGGSTLRGFAVNRLNNWAGVVISGAGGSTVAGNYLGVNASGSAASGPMFEGVQIVGSPNNTIGGTAAQDRNVIGGCMHGGVSISGAGATGNIVQGNYLGVNAAGNGGIGNETGVSLSIGGNTVGGTAAGARNLIGGSVMWGVYLGMGPNTVTGNWIGLNAAGTGAIANQYGVYVSSSGNVIGDTAAAARNVIAGNTFYGIHVNGAGASGNLIRNNFIGTTADGAGALPNGTGVVVSDAAGNTIGGTTAADGNLIARNTSSGVVVTGATAATNGILGNSITANGGLGIDLGNNGVTANDGARSGGQPNLYMDFPVFTSATLSGTTLTVAGYVGSAPNQATFAGARVEIFKSDNDGSGYGEGQTYLGFLTADGSGNVSGSLTVGGLAVGDRITGTATDGSNNTSEFGANFFVTALHDIAINGNFSDWCNGTGTEYCINDEGGPDDFSSPTKLDITRFGVASNLSNSMYLLVGFDDTSLNNATACVLFDTPTPVLNGRIDKVVCVSVSTSGVQSMELYGCNDTLVQGCGNASLIKSYTSASWGFSNSAAGPWNTDTFVEMAVPWSDLGFSSGEIILSGLISYAGGFLTSPKDSIFGVTSQNYDDRIRYDVTTGVARKELTPPTPSVGGTVYTDEGVTNVGAGKTVRLLVNGTSAGTATTDGSGSYFITTSASAGAAILVYIDDDPVYKGTAVTVFNGATLSNLDIYAGHVITRHDNGSSLTNANMSTAKGGSADADIQYSVSGVALTVGGSGTELYLPTGHGFAPGGNVTTPNLESRGTFAGGAGTLDVNGTLTVSGGTFTATSGTTSVSGNLALTSGIFAHNSGTVVLDGTNQAVSGSISFQNLTKSAASADTLTIEAGTTQTINGAVILNGAAGNLLRLRSASPGTRWDFRVNAGATKSISYIDVQDSDASTSATAQKPINPANSVNSGNTVAWFPGGRPDVMVKLSSEADSAYLTDNLYESTASAQTKSQGVLSGITSTYHLKFQNDGGATDNLVITGTGTGSGFTVQYLDNTGANRTADVTGAGGYTISNLAAGSSSVWTLLVTPSGNPTPVNGGTAYTVFVTAVSATDNTKIDQVKAVTASTSATLTLLKSADRATVAPGQDITYTVKATNGGGLTPASAVVVTDPIPAYTGFKVGSATFSALGSGLTGAAVAYSRTAAPGPYVYDYTPVDQGCLAPSEYDYCVTSVQWTMSGSQTAGTFFTVTFVVRVK
ncbi:MAG: DUF2341 domain-containing protein [Deltaproteobacteria bacterium]|nr:DUF2341 domain-containing protein [Deltaproteobacteria bacterium]